MGFFIATFDWGPIVSFPYSRSYKTHMPDLTASFPISTVFSVEYRQPGGQGARTWMKLGPRKLRAFCTFLKRSCGYAEAAVAWYGGLWAAMIASISFLKSVFPAGVVVVRAPSGVAPDRCMTVFP